MTSVQEAAMIAAGFAGFGLGLIYGPPGARRWALALFVGIGFYLGAAVLAAPVLPADTAPSVIGR